MYNQGDIVLMPFPYSDLTEAKQRPALILSNQKLNIHSDRICCLITSKPSEQGIKLPPSSFETGDLPFQSWIKPFRLFTIHEQIIKKRLATVSPNIHHQVLSEINDYLRLE